MTTNENESLKAARARYMAAAHGMQSGVAMKMNFDPADTTPKHLRTGVNASMSDLGGLAKLLIDKGLITEEEYFSAVADAMERERDTYQQEISEHFGRPVNLA